MDSSRLSRSRTARGEEENRQIGRIPEPLGPVSFRRTAICETIDCRYVVAVTTESRIDKENQRVEIVINEAARSTEGV